MLFFIKKDVQVFLQSLSESFNFFDSNSENLAQKISRITCMEYQNESKIAHIIIICSKEPVEQLWLSKALSFFDKTKINYI